MREPNTRWSPPRVYRTARQCRRILVVGLGLLVVAHVVFTLAARASFQTPDFEQQGLEGVIGLAVAGLLLGYVFVLAGFPCWLFRVWRSLTHLGVDRPLPWRLWVHVALPDDPERPYSGACWALWLGAAAAFGVTLGLAALHAPAPFDRLWPYANLAPAAAAGLSIRAVWLITERQRDRLYAGGVAEGL